MSAYTVLNTAIFNQLKGGTALISALGGTALYYIQAPDLATQPYVIWSWSGGGDENITPNRTKNLMILFRSFAATPAQAGSIDNLVDARLHNQTLTVTGWTNFWLARETEVALQENLPSGEKSYMAGAMYRIRLDLN
jgi:hypothetical protein